MLKIASYGCSQPFAGLPEQEIVLNVENRLSVKKASTTKVLVRQLPSFTLQKLNLGFPWYQKNDNNLGSLTVPVRLRPSPVYPGLHVQSCD